MWTSYDYDRCGGTSLINDLFKIFFDQEQGWFTYFCTVGSVMGNKDITGADHSPKTAR